MNNQTWNVSVTESQPARTVENLEVWQRSVLLPTRCQRKLAVNWWHLIKRSAMEKT